MIRAALLALVVGCAPAHADDFTGVAPLPYDCLPVETADEVHLLRGDTLLAHRQQGRYVDFLWLTAEGKFLHVSFDRATLNVCAVRITDYDPRDSVDG